MTFSNENKQMGEGERSRTQESQRSGVGAGHGGLDSVDDALNLLHLLDRRVGQEPVEVGAGLGGGLDGHQVLLAGGGISTGSLVKGVGVAPVGTVDTDGSLDSGGRLLGE